ncbi:hypothetical protein [Hymenobacter sp. B81]|uniref:hypothetical protein n=1 Tax=Hymenobacter sp. B81 TaxID=3344878 RepID=UPI0037DC43BD
MLRLLAKLALLALLTCGVLLLLNPALDAGAVDPFYRRFTTAPAGALILGSSRAAQGLQPRVLDSLLRPAGRWAGPLRNFAFTVAHSPYGPGYLRQISKKVRPGTRNGLFLLAVDPWSVSVEEQERASGELREADAFMGRLNVVWGAPNPEYLLRFGNRPLYEAYFAERGPTYLHADGWLEVRVGLDSAEVQARLEAKLRDYERLQCISTLSDERVQSLRETIQLLQRHGTVYLLRLPVSAPMRALEQRRWPGFDALVQQLAAEHGVAYLNYHADTSYATTDGNHLTPAAGGRLSRRVACDVAGVAARK